MEFKLIKLQLNCTDSIEKIEFSKQITFIHGETATGKSSVARLVDFCLGADFERTPALDKELVSAELYLKTAKYNLVIRREKGSKQVQASWTNNEGVTESRLVPLVKTDVPVFEDIYNLSDLLLYFTGLPNVKVAVNISDEISPVRLSFRDIMWYCYLKQDLLDSCFFNLDENSESNRRRKSRFVFRYITKLYTASISELEVELAVLEDKKKKRTQEIHNIRAFLNQFGYASEQQLQKDIDQARQELQNSKTELNKMASGFKADTHFADSLRDELINLAKRITDEEKALNGIQRKITEQESLRSELIALKFKLSRFEPAKTVLGGVNYEYCPACGLPVKDSSEDSKCILCRQEKLTVETPVQDKAVALDIDNRIGELEESLSKLNLAITSQKKSLTDLKNEKFNKDNALDNILKDYNSNFLLQSRALERNVAAFEQKIASLGQIAEMPKAVSILENEFIRYGLDEGNIKAQLDTERKKQAVAEQNVQQIEQAYKDALIAVSLPGLHAEDEVVIDRKTWIPKVIPHDKARGKWGFENIGSAGMKTLLNVCYVLAIHKVAQDNNLPLPSLLVLDSPSKNIDKEVNPKIFAALYQFIYDLSFNFGASIQFLLIDNNYYPPPNELDYMQRYMSQNDEKYPRLIKAYRD